jgi:hypothetical protein
VKSAVASAAALFCYASRHNREGSMKMGLEIAGAFVVAAIVFAVFRLIGMAIQIAAIGAALGLVVGFIAARMFRRE